MESNNDTKHFRITYQGQKYDTKEQIQPHLPEVIDYSNVEEITLSGNSYGREACDYIAEFLCKEKCPKLRTVNYNDLFVSRKLLELPGSLEVLIRAIMETAHGQVEHLNLSDNAFGPAGIKSFDFFLREASTLKTLKVTNCGLGPEGAEMIAEALGANKELRLSHFAAGRDRLENKGITALAKVFKEMGTLEVIEIPQNGIKKDGMLALFDALKANAETLREVHLHDNWIKGEAVERLVEFVLKAKKLEVFNVSDSTMGPQSAFLLIKAMSQAEGVRNTLKHFSCNYNEIEPTATTKRLLDILLSDEFTALHTVDFKGNSLGLKAAAAYIAMFDEKGRKLNFMEEDEEPEEDEELGEDEEDDDAGVEEDDIIQKLEKLKL